MAEPKDSPSSDVSRARSQLYASAMLRAVDRVQAGHPPRLREREQQIREHLDAIERIASQ